MICVNVRCRTEFTDGDPSKEYGLLFCPRCRQRAEDRFKGGSSSLLDAMDCGTMNDMLVEHYRRVDGRDDPSRPDCGWIDLEEAW